ncbi:MAG: efflux RND transporter periplasmic adaptor subunit [Bryobacterales bacterium]|nr:efflux RND transporter periplasmic adaptor subunit [Bryobacterales bacterium]
MKSNLWLAAAAIVLVACGEKAPKTAEATSAKPSPAADPNVVALPKDSPKLTRLKVEEVKNLMVPTEEVRSPGKIEANPNRISQVMLPVAGRIVTVAAKIGELVKQGQVLLTYESPDIDAAISAEQQAEAAVTQAKAVEAKAKADLDRVRDLFEHQAVAQKEVLNAEAVMIQAKAAVEQSLSVVSQTKRRLEILGIQPGQYGQRVAVKSPISGKVLEMTVVPGEFRNDTSNPLMKIADLSTVWVSADVPETSIRLITVGERLDVELSAYPGEIFHARVTQIADVVDPQTRTIKVRAELNNLHGRLRPEMFGRMSHTEAMISKPVVPAGAVVQEDGQTYVWTTADGNNFRRVPVQIADRFGDSIPISHGIAAGARVVTDGVMLLRSN